MYDEKEKLRYSFIHVFLIKTNVEKKKLWIAKNKQNKRRKVKQMKLVVSIFVRAIYGTFGFLFLLSNYVHIWLFSLSPG